MNNWEKMSRFILEENCYMELSITGEWWYCERKKNALTDYGPLEEIRDFIQREFPEKEDDDE